MIPIIGFLHIQIKFIELLNLILNLLVMYYKIAFISINYNYIDINISCVLTLIKI